MGFLPAAFDRRNFAKVTPKLCMICLFISLGNIIFGYDEQYFGAVNAMPAYVQQFGELKDGKYVLSASRVSFISSIAYVGKFVGCFVAGPCVGRFGHRYVMVAMSIIGVIGVIIQATSTHYVQYAVGRIVLYFAVALGEVSVPTYQAELVPGPARGAFVASLVFFNGFGGLISAIVTKVESPKLTKAAWLWPTCVAAIFPVLLFCGIWFVPSSPRWLIQHGRSEEAVNVLKKVRPKSDVALGHCEAEVAAIEEVLRGEQHEKGPWLELFKPGNRRRTMIAVVPMNFAQFTGIAFVASYGVRFYQSEGLGAQAFNYRLITTCCNLVACASACTLVVDHFGRRPMYIVGSLLQTLFLYLVAGLGLLKGPNDNTKHFFVACVMLNQITYSSIFAPIPYVYATEVGTPRMREKTMAFSAATNVFSAWFISFIIPYLLDPPYAALHSNVGWIFGTIAIMSALFGYFYLPETKGRALEELDACFAEGIPARKFDKFISTGAAGRIAGYEAAMGLHADDMEAQRKADAMHMEELGPNDKAREAAAEEIKA